MSASKKTKTKKSSFVLDSYALLTFFLEQDGANQVEKLLRDAKAGKIKLFCTEINLGEIYYSICKRGDANLAQQALEACLLFPITFLPANWEFVLASAKLKARYPLSYADAFCVHAAIVHKCPIVTNDEEFKLVKEIRTFWFESLA